MTILGNLIIREFAMFVVLAALGAGPASFLSRRFDVASRVFLAPAFGLALGTSVFTTSIWLLPAGTTFWLVPVLAAASCCVAFMRWRRRDDSASGRRPDIRPRGALLQALVVVVAVAGPATALIAHHHSVGPVAYRIGDVDGYVAVTDAMQHESLRDLEQAKQPWPNAVLSYAAGYAQSPQNLEATPLYANVNELFGWGSTETQSAFLLAIMVSGGLGIFAAVTYAMGRRTWAGVLGGSMFGGALFLQLFFDGSQAALAGMCLVLPLVVIASETIRNERLAHYILLALLTAGVLAIYPLFVPSAALAAAFVLLALAIWGVRSRKEVTPRTLGAIGARLAATLVLAVLLNLVAFTRDFDYWRGVLHGTFLSPGQPRYALSAATVPGWLVQTRSTYLLRFGGHSVLANLFFAGLVPVAAAAVMVVGARRNRVAWVAAALVVSCALLAAYSGSRRITGTNLSCSYCIDRNLLPVAPAFAFLIALGIGTLALSTRLPARGAAATAAVLLVVVTGYSVSRELQLFSKGSFFLDTSVASVLEHYPSGAPPLELEGFNEGPNAWAEQPLVAYAAEERFWGFVSLPADYSDNNALAYVGTQSLSDPQFRSGYGYVLTRLPGVNVDRDLVVRKGGVALERRRAALDVTVDSGVVVGALQGDRIGRPILNPWSHEAIRFIVTGSRARTVAVQIVFSVPARQRLAVSSPDGRELAVRRRGRTVHVCVEPPGAALIRTVQLTVARRGVVQLVSMTVAEGECGAARPARRSRPVR